MSDIKDKLDYGQTMRKYGIFVVLVLFVLISTALKPDIFLSWDNIISILVQISMTVILACGECSLILAGSVDLSAGSLVALTGTLMVGVYGQTGNIALAFLVAIAAGMLIGLINGAVITHFALPAFIVTLGTQILSRGIALLYANGMPIPVTGETFRILGQGKLFGAIPYPILVAAGVVLLTLVLVNNTPFGRALYAIGGNVEAARASGIRVNRVLTLTHVFMGVLAAITGYILMSRTNVGQPSGAVNYEFDAIIGTILGGTSFSGGIGSIGGAVVGCMLMGVLANIMNLINISPYLQYVVKGVIILLAVMFDATTKRVSMRVSVKAK